MKSITIDAPLAGFKAAFRKVPPFRVGEVDADDGKPGDKKPVVILAAWDFTKDAMEAAHLAMEVARRTGGRLLLVHAVNLNLNPYGPISLTKLREDLCQEAFEQSKGTIRRAGLAGVAAFCAVEEGEPAEVIARAAARWDPAMIVISSRKRRSFRRWFGRSLAERVVEMVKCPVLILRTETEPENAHA